MSSYFTGGGFLFRRIGPLLGCSKFNKQERDDKVNDIFQHCCFETLKCMQY